ncbi:MAG: putative zinc-binding peptidase [Rhodospirillales bacterium]|nr:putative zinc-binding peptidase [Rhodospirillales bacterium]
MKLFACQNCGQLVYFENTRCEHCQAPLGFLPEIMALTALSRAPDGSLSTLATPPQAVRYCENAVHNVCNWLLPVNAEQTLCRACALNRTIPDLTNADHVDAWRRLEGAKHRLVYAILRLRLPLIVKSADVTRGLAYDFLADPDPTFRESAKVITGHDDGLITINIAEADDAEREKHRQNMAEPYRTLLGHFRHEVGHYYWDRLILDGGRVDSFRQMFGDEQQDYTEALEVHYRDGPPANWRERFVSAYASTHAWEDWAETWAHYMHIVDTLETAHAFGIRVKPRAVGDPSLDAVVDFDPYGAAEFDDLIDVWLPLTYAVNSLNRSMGQPDLYPFVLAPAVIDKLRFIHGVIDEVRT